MINRRSCSFCSLVFAGACAWLASGVTACSSGELESKPQVSAHSSSEGPSVARESQADSVCTFNSAATLTGSSFTPSSPAWWSLGGSNHMAFMDAGIDLICAISLSTVGQVICYTPPSTPDQVFPSHITNWGLNGGGDTNGVPIAPNTIPIAVALVKDTSLPKRSGGGYYAVTVLLSDSTVMITFGNTEEFYQGDNFATYQPFVSPVTTDGQPLSLKKIIWMNEDAGADPKLPGPYLWALSNDNKLYYDAGGVWGFDSADVQDVSRIAGRGMTVLYTDGSIGYYDFQEGGYGWLPNPPSENIVALGGLYALTDAGCGGDCSDDNPTFCAGDDRRILHFNWLEWQWETFEDQLAQAGASVANYYPFAPPYTCSGCSPQMTESIVDPHGFGSNNDGAHFDVGPFVYWAGGSRIQFYTLQGGLPGQFHWCNPSSFSACYVVCGTQLDGTPCLQIDGTPGACRGTALQCQPCGDVNQVPCPGLDCSKVAGGGVAIGGFCNPQ